MIALLPIAISFLKPYQKSRILTFLNPERDPLGAGYQIIQSKIAIGSGGFLGKGYIKGSQSHLEFIPEMHEYIMELFLSGNSLVHSWSEMSMNNFFRLVRPADPRHNLDHYLSAGIYLRKRVILKDGKERTVFPLPKAQRLENLPFSENLTFHKLTMNLVSVDNEDSLSRVTAWSDPRRCNGKTLIPLHPDHVSEEILERYGTDVYGGFKPCQRYVKKNLRCPHHM